jgi:ribosomal protein L29
VVLGVLKIKIFNMKKKELEKFKNKSVAQLNKEISDLREKAWDSKQSIFKGKEKNVRKAAALRRDIAQLATFKSVKIKEEMANVAKEKSADKPANPGKAGKPANRGKAGKPANGGKAGKLANKAESK